LEKLIKRWEKLEGYGKNLEEIEMATNQQANS
jgi:hypothetical protein